MEWQDVQKALGGSSYGPSLSSIFEFIKTYIRNLNNPRLWSSEISHKVLQQLGNNVSQESSASSFGITSYPSYPALLFICQFQCY